MKCFFEFLQSLSRVSLRARVIWSKYYKKLSCLCLVPATQSWNSFYRTHIDFILFSCFRFRRHLGFFVLIFLQENKRSNSSVKQHKAALTSPSKPDAFFFQPIRNKTKVQFPALGIRCMFSSAWRWLHGSVSNYDWFKALSAFVVGTMVLISSQHYKTALWAVMLN